MLKACSETSVLLPADIGDANLFVLEESSGEGNLKI